MGTRKKKRPEFELPNVLIEAIQEYLGPTAVNNLRNDQAVHLMSVANYCAGKVGEILESDEPPTLPMSEHPDHQPH